MTIGINLKIEKTKDRIPVTLFVFFPIIPATTKAGKPKKKNDSCD